MESRELNKTQGEYEEIIKLLMNAMINSRKMLDEARKKGFPEESYIPEIQRLEINYQRARNKIINQGGNISEFPESLYFK